MNGERMLCTNSPYAMCALALALLAADAAAFHNGMDEDCSTQARAQARAQA